MGDQLVSSVATAIASTSIAASSVPTAAEALAFAAALGVMVASSACNIDGVFLTLSLIPVGVVLDNIAVLEGLPLDIVGVHEEICSPILLGDEAIPLHGVEKLHGSTGGHFCWWLW